MPEGFVVRPLKCGHCGKELPVTGQFVTFKCSTCFKHWMLTPRGLEPANVFKIHLPEDAGDTAALLPFWVIEADLTKLRSCLETSFDRLCASARTILKTKIETEGKEPLLEIFSDGESGPDRGLMKAQFLSETSRKRSFPTSAEFNHLIGRLVEKGRFMIYVPAFLSYNTYAYLKIGRLLTKLQPSFRIEKPSDRDDGVLCAMQMDEAVSLMNFIFLATLPDSMQNYGDLLQDVHLTPAAPPRLVEFPFRRQGAYLLSLIGGFQISNRLVEGLDRFHTPEHSTT